MLELKVDDADGTPRIMEMNPRFWGSLALALRAGVDFPWLLYQLASVRPPAPPAPIASASRVAGSSAIWITS